jgi:hypothetical protein
MKRTSLLVSLLAITLSALAGAFGQAIPVQPGYPTQQAGRILVSSYANWTDKTLNAVTATSTSVTLNNCNPRVGSDGKAIAWGSIFAVNVPIQIYDGANSESVTPTAITAPSAAGPSAVNPINCGFTATFANAHSANVQLGSGDNGLMEALNDAYARGESMVTASGDSGLTIANITGQAPNGLPGWMTIEYFRGQASTPMYFTIQPSTLTALTTPAVRVATATCGGTTTVCDGTAVGTWTNAAQYVAVTCVDVLGGESAASTTAHYTSAGSLAINFTAPAAETGCVGWLPYIGLAYLTTAYRIPVTSSTCTLSPFTPYPTCAITNTAYGEVGSNGVFPTPYVHSQLVPQAGGVAAAYNPNPISHTTFAFTPTSHLGLPGFETNYGPFIHTVALTAGQSGVLGTIQLPAGVLNYIGQTLRITGKAAYTPTTGGTAPEIAVELGDLTDFTTGTPIVLCTLLETHTTTTAAYSVSFQCNLDTNATGATGSIMPSGWLIDGLQAGTTVAISAPEQATGAITADVLDQDTLFVVFLQTSSAETTGPQLLDLHVELVN